MHHFFVSPEQIGEKEIVITGPDVSHIRQVLRMRQGEEVWVRTGLDDRMIRCRISSFQAQAVCLDILWVEHENAELPSSIWLFQGLPKSDKMEWIIQKAVELGAAGIVPVAMRRCVMRLEGEKAVSRVKRWSAIAQSAAQQSKRMLIPEIKPVMSFQSALEMARKMDHILIPYELAEDMEFTRQTLSGIRPGESVAVFIGPEGGLEREEVEKAISAGASAITLGRRILRTETAGMALIAALMLQLEGR